MGWPACVSAPCALCHASICGVTRWTHYWEALLLQLKLFSIAATVTLDLLSCHYWPSKSVCVLPLLSFALDLCVTLKTTCQEGLIKCFIKWATPGDGEVGVKGPDQVMIMMMKLLTREKGFNVRPETGDLDPLLNLWAASASCANMVADQHLSREEAGLEWSRTRQK